MSGPYVIEDVRDDLSLAIRSFIYADEGSQVYGKLYFFNLRISEVQAMELHYRNLEWGLIFGNRTKKIQ